MKNRFYFILIIIIGLTSGSFSQQKNLSLSANIDVSEELKQTIKPDGRLFLFLTQNPNVEPRTQTWPSPGRKTDIFASNLSGFNGTKNFIIDQSTDWTKTTEWNLDNVPEGVYYIQVLWDQDQSESNINSPGNIYSEKVKIEINQSVELDITLSKIIEPVELVSHELVRWVEFDSEVLSKWWGKPVQLKASVLLPSGYIENNDVSYPIRYNVAGYGGRYTRINYMVNSKRFMDWWTEESAPQVISVFLDGEGPFGDSYQMDSDNSGPYGYALIHELIPHIESLYRGTSSAETRFVDGCSTGGWVSLGLQLYYPDFFNGAYSFSPDAVEFENYQLLNIYKDKNAFVNEFNYPRPVMRDVSGEPMLSLKDFIQYENVLGVSNTFQTSGGQIGSHTALYSPKGEDGLPKPMFDPISGVVNKEVAEYWKKYDFKIYARENWSELGPKIQGKIFIWMGDMDHFYLNTATRAFSKYLETTTDPVSDAEIIFSPMEGHCSQYSHKNVLLKIQEKLNE